MEVVVSVVCVEMTSGGSGEVRSEWWRRDAWRE